MTRHDEPAEGYVVGVAEVLAAHQRVLDGAGSCRCGKWPLVEHDVPWPDHQADALRDLLAAAEQRGRVAALRKAADNFRSDAPLTAAYVRDCLRADADRDRATERAQ